MIYSLGTNKPKIADQHYIAPGAHVVGNVVLGNRVSIWFNAVLRGDNDMITIGDETNVQDGCILHIDKGFPMHIGKRVTVGHKAMLHGCTIGDGSLIGMNAVVLNGAVVGKHCLIGANALVTEGMEIPDNSLVLGSPASVKKTVTDDMRVQMDAGAQHYVDKIEHYRKYLQPMPDAD